MKSKRSAAEENLLGGVGIAIVYGVTVAIIDWPAMVKFGRGIAAMLGPLLMVTMGYGALGLVVGLIWWALWGRKHEGGPPPIYGVEVRTSSQPDRWERIKPFYTSDRGKVEAITYRLGKAVARIVIIPEEEARRR